MTTALILNIVFATVVFVAIVTMLGMAIVQSHDIRLRAPVRSRRESRRRQVFGTATRSEA
jgi:hypothetical protein